MYEAGRAGGKYHDAMGVCKTEQNRGLSCHPPCCVSSTMNALVCLCLARP